MLKGGKKGKFCGKFTLDTEVKIIFKQLKAAFVIAPILCHFDPVQKICIESDTSGFAISAVISQIKPNKGQWHPITYWSQKMTLAKRNYGMGEAEMLAIVSVYKQ